MARRRKSKKSRRGGGSAPQRCKTALRKCMVDGTKKKGERLEGKGKTRGGLASRCMRAFNRCR